MVNRAFHEDETEYAKSLCKIAGTFQNQSMLVWMEYSELTRKTRCPPCLIWPQPVALQHPVLIGPTASGCRSRSRISSLRGRHHAFYNGRRTIQINLNLKCIYSWLWCPPVEEDEKKQVFYFSSFALTFPSTSTLSKPLLGFSLYGVSHNKTCFSAVTNLIGFLVLKDSIVLV